MQNNIKFEKISIIGCGLIGSSILRNINKKEISRSITVFDKSKEIKPRDKASQSNSLQNLYPATYGLLHSLNCTIQECIALCHGLRVTHL